MKMVKAIWELFT